MSRTAESAFPEVADVFDPPLYTDGELEFIRDNLGLTSYMASQTATEDENSIPTGLVIARQEDMSAMSRVVGTGPSAKQDRPSAVDTFEKNTGKALQRFYELDEIAKHRGYEWMVFHPKERVNRPGYEGVRVHLGRWLKRRAMFEELKASDREGKGFHPEMWTIREGAPVWSGRGTDSGRVRFPLNLVPMDSRSYDDYSKEAYAMNVEDNGSDPTDVLEPKPEGGDLLSLDSIRTDRGYPCPVEGCAYVAEFDPDSQISVNQAERSLGVHMKKPKGKFKVEDHRDMVERIFT